MKKLFLLLVMSLAFMGCSDDKEELVSRNGLYIDLDTGERGGATAYFDNFEERRIAYFDYVYGNLPDYIRVNDSRNMRKNPEERISDKRFKEIMGYEFNPDDFIGYFSVDYGNKLVLLLNN